MKKKFLLFLMLLMPLNALAYSNRIAVSGDNIGIEAHSNGVYIIDFYKINNKYTAKNAGFHTGDIITEIDNNKVKSINDLNNIINEEGKYNVKVIRDYDTVNLSLNVIEDNNTIKTGLYVKDQINGIGTLSYVDPETHIFASLGHEIIESSSSSKFKLNNGYIFDIDVNSINKNTERNVGELHAKFSNVLLGNINKNETNGIYGLYNSDISSFDLYDVGSSDEIVKGEAYLKLKLDNEESRLYSINIISIDEREDVKNILFEVNDKDLIKKTGGIVQGMSGSPIIQNNKIIGAVNYVVMDDNKKGYGIFIETMLKEGDKLLN